MNPYNIALIIILVLFAGCNTKLEEEKVLITDYRIWLSNLDKKETKSQYEAMRITKNTGNERSICYKINGPSFFNCVFKNDSLFYEGVYCQERSFFKLKYANQPFKIKVFYYNDISTSDEESYVFWNDTYGLIGINNWVWGGLTLIANEGYHDFINETFYEYIINKKRKNLEKQNAY